MALQHDLPLVSTIAVGFSAAFICGFIASKIRLSPIVGYLIAGVLIGPFTPGFVADVKIAEQLSEVGILLLMFGVGLHFSLKDLIEVRRIALPGALAQIAVATSLGWACSYLWGWPLTSGIVFGLALSVASTVVLLRALEEHNLLQTTNGNIAIGWLIVEDIVMVLALVLIPALAPDMRTGDIGEVLFDVALAIGKVIVFVVFMIGVGRRILPWILASVARLRSREMFTVAVFAVAMGVAFAAATLFGISLTLGAFFAGMMIRESDLSHEAAAKALPLQDAFAVLFFVAVGMLFNPYVLIEHPLEVLAVVAIIVVGKSVAGSAIVLFFRYPLKTAMLVSAGLAQIGEFSFILANIGVINGILSPDARDFILAGALISISLNPSFFYLSRVGLEWIKRRPQIAAMFNISSDRLAQLASDKKQQLKEVVVLVGHGRVGQHVSANFNLANRDLVIVDANRDRIEELREKGFFAIAGDANQESVLREAALDQALAIVVAVPNPFEARRIVEAARSLNPSIKVLVRAHNEEEMMYFTKQGVDLAIVGAREVGRRIIDYLNHR